MNVEYLQGQEELFSAVHPMWEKQKDYHAAISAFFSELFNNQKFNLRRTEIENNVHNGKLKIIVAKDIDKGINIGYCVALVDKKSIGEIESVYVDESYRRNGIASYMMQLSLNWMDENNVNGKTLTVAVGNEEVLDFYKALGFLPFSVKLKSK